MLGCVEDVVESGFYQNHLMKYEFYLHTTQDFLIPLCQMFVGGEI